MPKLQLTQQFADNPPAVKNKSKTDYFDTRITGFLLEVRSSGKATYYQRYRDNHRRNRQVRIGPSDSMTLGQARDMAKQIRTNVSNGLDPNDLSQKHRESPTFKEFVDNQYLPHVKLYKRSWELDKQMIELHIMPLWGEAKLSEITREDIQKFQADFIKMGTGK